MKPSKLGSSVERIIHAISGSIIWASVVTIFLMMLLSCSDVLGRFLLNKPIKAVPEVIELMMVVAIFLGVAHVAAGRGHIRVDAFYSRLSRRPQVVLDSITSFLCAGTVTLMVWRLSERALTALLEPLKGGATGILMVPHGPFLAVAAIGCLALGLEFWLQFFLTVAQPAEK